MMDKRIHFQCDMCGLCCQMVGNSEMYSFLDRGDGVCTFYEENTHKCSIYYFRPLKCNVDAFYDMYFKLRMSREEFYEKNYECCEKIKKENKKLKACK